ncbi:MAG: hypothetical protein HUU54_06895 [Ignavibacteriaceae bacterium]|nr:hypothetical protein [Ignavibacteriaceae bacterium]
MAPQPIVHDWNIKEGDYMRDANYDKLYFDGRRRKAKIRKLIIAGIGMALVVVVNLVFLNLAR